MPMDIDGFECSRSSDFAIFILNLTTSDDVARCAPAINVGSHASRELKELALQNLKHLIDEIHLFNQ